MEDQLKDFYPALDLFLKLKNKPSIWNRHPKVGAHDVISFIVNYIDRLILMRHKAQPRYSHSRIFLTPSIVEQIDRNVIVEQIDRNVIDATSCFDVINNLYKLGLCK